MSEAEDLEELKSKIQAIKINCFASQLYIANCTPENLKNTGHKTQADGVLYLVKKAAEDIKKLNAAFIRKWPD